jgi:hypothetical protein
MGRGPKTAHGFTLLELIVASDHPVNSRSDGAPRVTIQREKERNSAGHFGRCVTKIKPTGRRFRLRWDTYGYPPDLEMLVKGVESRETQQSSTLSVSGLDPCHRPLPPCSLGGAGF